VGLSVRIADTMVRIYAGTSEESPAKVYQLRLQGNAAPKEIEGVKPAAGQVPKVELPTPSSQEEPEEDASSGDLPSTAVEIIEHKPQELTSPAQPGLLNIEEEQITQSTVLNTVRTVSKKQPAHGLVWEFLSSKLRRSEKVTHFRSR